MQHSRRPTRTSSPARNSSSSSNGSTGSPPAPPASSTKLSNHPARQRERRLGTHMATETVAKPRTSVRVHVQKFGTFLSGMIMPNIGAFIAWGLITALFIEKGWIPVPALGGFGTNAAGTPNVGLVGPMITYLLPLLIGYTGCKKVYDVRGGVVGAIGTMGVIVGAGIPMFIGAMIMGPLGGWTMKKIDSLWDGKIRPGFEMLVNNFSAGSWSALLAMLAFYAVAPVVSVF